MSDILGTLIPLAIVIALLVIVIKIAVNAFRHDRNKVREALGKNSAEYDKAIKLMKANVKGQLLPKCIAEDAILTLNKYYTEKVSIEGVRDILARSQVKLAMYPRDLYMKPGTSKEKLAQMCKAQFKNFNMQSLMKENGSVTDKDFEKFKELSYMWFFADNDVQTTDESMEKVKEVFEEFCAEYAKAHGMSKQTQQEKVNMKEREIFSPRGNNDISRRILNEQKLLGDIAELIFSHATPFVAYLKKNFPTTDSSFYGFFPLLFILELIHNYSIGNDHALVYALEKEIEKRANYSSYTNETSSFEDCGVLKMAWEDGIWDIYSNQTTEVENKDELVSYVFVRILAVTANNNGKIDNKITELAGAALGDYSKELDKLLINKN